jgi:uncharacterized protein
LAEAFLGSAYQYGLGVEKNEYEAVKWYRKGAEQGNSVAQDFLSFAYDMGSGVPRDKILADMWITLAVNAQEKGAKLHRWIIEFNMTPEQIAKARQLADEWRPTFQPASTNQAVPPASQEK